MTRPERRRGPGRLGLEVLGDELSGRDLAVLTELSRHRFLSSLQLQQLLFHTHRSERSAARTCRRVLARLEAERLIERLDRRVGGLRGGSTASVWTVSGAGQRLLSLQSGAGAATRVREPGHAFVAHYLAVADAHLALVAAEREQRLELLQVELEPTCWRQYVDAMGARQVLKPDLFVVTATADYEEHWFVEVDRGTEGIPTLIRQCQAYARYRVTGQEQAASGVFPRVIWMLPAERRVARLQAALQAARSLDPDVFRIVTTPDLVPLILGGTT